MPLVDGANNSFLRHKQSRHSELWAAVAGIGDVSRGELTRLEALRTQLTRQKRQIAIEIKNEERKRTRRIERARGLSDDDLLGIITARAAAKAKAKGNAKAKAKAKAKATAKAKGNDNGVGGATGSRSGSE